VGVELSTQLPVPSIVPSAVESVPLYVGTAKQGDAKHNNATTIPNTNFLICFSFKTLVLLVIVRTTN